MPAIIDPDPITSTSPRTNVKTGVCPLCGATLHDLNACDRCDWVLGYGQSQDTVRRNPRDLFAAILSLFWPGAGHFYKGHVKIAAVLAVLGVMCFLWSITFFMFFGFLSLPAYWIAVALHAYFMPDLKHPAVGAAHAH